MAHQVYNSLEKLNPPPFITTLVPLSIQSVIFKSWSTLRRKLTIGELSKLLQSESELLAGFITRKGTQLRLEKALMLSNRIHKLGKRWLANKLLQEFSTFDDGVQLSLQNKTSNATKAADEEEKAVRLPSRQWANWIIYLTLRDSLILAKIKYECERTVKYWLGLISSSHHAADSLVAVGILSRMWYVSSCMVECLITVMYPTVCKLSIHLEPTKAENWLKDLEIPGAHHLHSWLAEILGSPFLPARLSKGMNTIAQEVTQLQSKLKSGLKLDSKSITNTKSTLRKQTVSATLPTSSVHQAEEGSEEEDLGVEVQSSSQKESKHIKKTKKTKIELNERWTRFFSGHKTKINTEKGKRQFCVRIKKYLGEENDKKIITRLKKLRKSLKSCSNQDIIVMINQFQKFLSKQISS